jgi:hypothetical protein
MPPVNAPAVAGPVSFVGLIRNYQVQRLGRPPALPRRLTQLGQKLGDDLLTLDNMLTVARRARAVLFDACLLECRLQKIDQEVAFVGGQR